MARGLRTVILGEITGPKWQSYIGTGDTRIGERLAIFLKWSSVKNFQSSPTEINCCILSNLQFVYTSPVLLHYYCYYCCYHLLLLSLLLSFVIIVIVTIIYYYYNFYYHYYYHLLLLSLLLPLSPSFLFEYSTSWGVMIKSADFGSGRPDLIAGSIIRLWTLSNSGCRLLYL